ncbi:MAG: hypothetical protein U5K51_06570 [Flavobacteriaceae bacterium]|nr:hypothetical protein [Flavobacteriaceae bacterium]
MVRIHARRLRQALDFYYRTDGLEDPIFITIPLGRYVPVFEERNSAIQLIQNKPTKPQSEMDLLPVIAIMPFNKIQSDIRLEVICSILRMDLSAELSRFQELAVITNYSVEVAFLKSDNMNELAAELGLDFLLTGTCDLQGEVLKLTMKLIDIKRNQIVWEEVFFISDHDQREMKFYQAIIQKVLGQVGGFFGAVYRNKLENIPAPVDYSQLYAVYWFNNYHLNFSQQAFHEVLTAVETGLRENPKNGLLTAFYGELYLNLLVMDVKGEAESNLKKGTQLAMRSIELDPLNQHAYQVLAWSDLLRHDKPGFIKSAEKCLSINPNNAMYIGQMGFAYICAGEYERGMDLLLQSLERNPFYPWNLNVGFILYYLVKKDFQEAVFWANKINRPFLYWDPLFRTAIYGLLKDVQRAEESKKELLALNPEFSLRSKQIVNTFILDGKAQCPAA